MYVFMYVCMCVCMHVCMAVRMGACVTYQCYSDELMSFMI